ncbi:MAG: XisH family protein [Chloroflexota bacterium]
MSALDLIHEAVKNALIKDGWVITADPYTIKYKEVTLFADLGADRPIAAERGEQKIAVEIKSFVNRSPLRELELALGQYLLYGDFLALTDPERKLYLAISQRIYDGFFQQKAIQLVVQQNQLPLIVVNIETEEIGAWIN